MAGKHTSEMRCESGTFRAIGKHPRATRQTEYGRADASSRRTQIASIVHSIAARDSQTANLPLTQGYEMSLRQPGFALNVHHGLLPMFLTTNFAYMYSP